MTTAQRHEVFLKELRYQDWELVFAWRQDPEVTKTLPTQERAPTWAQHVRWIQGFKGSQWLILVAGLPGLGRKEQRYVGMVQVKDDGEVGILIGARDVWGKGIATGALRGLLEMEWDMPLWAVILPDNEVSGKLFARAGFVNTHQSERTGQERWELKR